MKQLSAVLDLNVTKCGFLECAHNVIVNQLKENIKNNVFVHGIFPEMSARKDMFKYCIRSFEKNTDYDFFAYLELYDADFVSGTLMELLNQHNQLKNNIPR